MTAQVREPSPLLTRFVVASRYMPVFVALIVLWVFALIWVPSILDPLAIRAQAPYAAILAVLALGQMLVIMTGGIDLSVPGTIALTGMVLVTVNGPSDALFAQSLLAAIAVGAIIGLINGLLIGGLRLNALIVTLAVGQLAAGVAFRSDRPGATPTAPGWALWTRGTVFGLNRVFFTGLLLTAALILVFRYTTIGRKFQVAGANPQAAQVVGVRVRMNRISAYMVAGVFSAIGGAMLAGLHGSASPRAGAGYLLAPIAAVVIGGAALTGGLASPLATFAAAIFLTWLDQTMLTMGLPTSMQMVVFGLVIVAGMMVSGDRIIKGVERVLRERRRPKRTDGKREKATSGTG